MNANSIRSFVLSVLSANYFTFQSYAQVIQTTSPPPAPAVSGSNEAAPFDGAKQVYLAGDQSYRLGDYEEGIKQFKSACLARPEPEYCNALAWAYATCPQKNLRNGSGAVLSAIDACEATEYKNPDYLDTYASSLAELGDFDKAVKLQKKAIELATNSKTFPKSELASLQFRLELFDKQTAYSEVPQSAILEEYKKIVGTKLSKDSLAKVTYDQETELMHYVEHVPESQYIRSKEGAEWDIALLILTSKSFDHDDRKYWFHRLSKMTDDQVDALRNTLLEQHEKLDSSNKQIQQAVATILRPVPAPRQEQAEKISTSSDTQPQQTFPSIPRRRPTAEQQQAEQVFIDAQAAYNSGNYAEGLKKFRAACMASENPRFQNLWAWGLATCPDEKLRSPLAVSIADKACGATDYKNPKYLDSLAAAYAQMADFDSAVKWQTKVVELAPDSKKFAPQELPSVSYRLTLYKRKIPYREVPQTAILAKYKDIVGARLSGASLRDVTADQKTKLIEYLRMVPERNYLNMATGHDVTREHWDLVLLILTTESMDHKERDKWFRSIPDMDSTNIDRLRRNMIEEREQLVATDKEYQERISQK